MDSVLIAAGSEKSAATLGELLRAGHNPAVLCSTTKGAEARRLMLEREFELAVISAPLTDENGVDLAMDLSQYLFCGIVLIVGAPYAEDIGAGVGKHGVFVLEKPIHRPFFHSSIRVIESSLAKMRTLENKAVQLQGRIEDLRLIDRAKCTLMECRGFSEQQAHRYIEKEAMDFRLPKRQVAEKIIKENQTPLAN